MKEQFGAFTATELYCPKCKVSQPVRERLLLVLPAGELHEYICSRCATSLGERTTTAQPKPLAVPGAAVPKQAQRRLLR